MTIAAMIVGPDRLRARWRALRPPPEPLGRPSASFVSLWGLSFPNFALGPILILFFAIYPGVVACFRFRITSPSGSPGHYYGRLTGGHPDAYGAHGHAEELGQDYIRTARAKGLPERVVVYKHALRNAMVPVPRWWGFSSALYWQARL